MKFHRRRIIIYSSSDESDVELERELAYEAPPKEVELPNAASTNSTKPKKRVISLVRCQVPGCPASITQLPRHMRLVHGVEKKRAKFTKLEYNI